MVRVAALDCLGRWHPIVRPAHGVADRPADQGTPEPIPEVYSLRRLDLEATPAGIVLLKDRFV